MLRVGLEEDIETLQCQSRSDTAEFHAAGVLFAPIIECRSIMRTKSLGIRMGIGYFTIDADSDVGCRLSFGWDPLCRARLDIYIRCSVT